MIYPTLSKTVFYIVFVNQSGNSWSGYFFSEKTPKRKKAHMFRKHPKPTLTDIDHLNYGYDKDHVLCQVSDQPRATKDQDIVHVLVTETHPEYNAYKKYWSNNWRKIHGYPLRRGTLNSKPRLIKPVLLTVEETKRLREQEAKLQALIESVGDEA